MQLKPSRFVTRQRASAAALALLLAGIVAGCGSSSTSTSAASSSAASSSAASSSSGAAGKCGTIPANPDYVVSPANLLAGLPASYRATYQSFDGTVEPSAYSNWKPNGKGPYTVGIVWGSLSNPFETGAFAAMQRDLKASPLVGKVIADAAPSNDPAPQLQQYESEIQQGAQIILAQPNSEAVFTPAIIAAGKKGVPTLLGTLASPSPYSVDIDQNTFYATALGVNEILKSLNYSAQALFVHGIPAVSVDAVASSAFTKALAQCPHATLAGSVDGEFAPPTVISSILQFLTTHPQPITLAGQTATMGPPVLQAFKQSGHTVPPLVDNSTQDGSMAYLADTPGYKGVAIPAGPMSFANLATRVALRMLAGQGLKVKVVIWPSPVLDQAQAKQYVQSSWTLSTPGYFDLPSSTWISNSTLDSLFNHPNLTTGINP